MPVNGPVVIARFSRSQSLQVFALHLMVWILTSGTIYFILDQLVEVVDPTRLRHLLALGGLVLCILVQLFWIPHLLFIGLGALQPNRPALWIDEQDRLVYLSPLVLRHKFVGTRDWTRSRSHMIGVDYRVNITKNAGALGPSFTLDVLDLDYDELLDRVEAVAR